MGRSAATLLVAGPFVGVLARLGCDVVWTNTITVPAGAPGARVLGIPHVWQVHEFGHDDHRLRFDLGWSGELDRLVAELGIESVNACGSPGGSTILIPWCVAPTSF